MEMEGFAAFTLLMIQVTLSEYVLVLSLLIFGCSSTDNILLTNILRTSSFSGVIVGPVPESNSDDRGPLEHGADRRVSWSVALLLK